MLILSRFRKFIKNSQIPMIFSINHQFLSTLHTSFYPCLMVSDSDVSISRVESISVSSFFRDTLTGYLSQTVLQGIPLAVGVLELPGGADIC